ncbi:hypothetical protein AB1K84_04425 [Mesobacillus foraminis]|uniref:hypothetical protein n=1 Tax=Mesobacillus foraminis TaxID=279826 RepID=UPI0039A2320A
MPEIKISPQGVKMSNSSLRHISGRLSELSAGLSSVRVSIDYEIQSRRSIGSRLSKACYSLDVIENKLKALESFTIQAADQYSRTESFLTGKANSIIHSGFGPAVGPGFARMPFVPGGFGSAGLVAASPYQSTPFTMAAQKTAVKSAVAGKQNPDKTSPDAMERWIQKRTGVLAGELMPEDQDGWYGNPLYYKLDLTVPTTKDTFYHDAVNREQIGGEAQFVLADAGGRINNVAIHEQLVALEAKLQYDATGVQAKAAATFQDIGADADRWKAHLKVGTAEALAEVKDGHIAAGAKADLAKAEGEVKIDIPHFDLDLVLGGDLAFGSIGGEAKLGMQNELSLGFGLFGAGLKFGFEPEEDEDEK